MSLLINETLELIQKEYRLEEPKWRTGPMTEDDILFLADECNKDSEFDTEKFRQTRFTGFIKGESPHMVAKCDYGQVFVIFDNASQANDIPWGLWGRILRTYSEKRKKPFKVFLLANTQKREFPPVGEPILPKNINGGYTYRCNRETILIYRAEDATRVLLHELMHSCCLDDAKNDLDTMEAETEAWAEFMYTAFLSQGSAQLFHHLLQKQSEWMYTQNEEVKKHMKSPQEFPWRYTIGKEEVWKRLGLFEKKRGIPGAKKSLRLTYPPTDKLKKVFNVKMKSTIL
jgi:hypothetical protein